MSAFCTHYPAAEVLVSVQCSECSSCAALLLQMYPCMQSKPWHLRDKLRITRLGLKSHRVLCDLNSSNQPDAGLGAGVHLGATSHASPCSFLECKANGWCSFHPVPPCSPPSASLRRDSTCRLSGASSARPELTRVPVSLWHWWGAATSICHTRLPFFLHPSVRPPSPVSLFTSAAGATVPSRDGNCPFAIVLVAICFGRWFGVYGCGFLGLLIDSLSFCLCVFIKCCLKCCLWSPRYKLKICLITAPCP